MGMFDYIQDEVKCLNCSEEFIVEEQIKWTDCCTLHLYNIGDRIQQKMGNIITQHGLDLH